MTKAEALVQRRRWERALAEIAREVGKDAPLYKAMGPLAWGRHEYESKASGDTVDHVMRGVGYLEGTRDALLRAAEIGRWDGERALRHIHVRIAGMR